jgi:hypothetical protein
VCYQCYARCASPRYVLQRNHEVAVMLTCRAARWSKRHSDRRCVRCGGAPGMRVLAQRAAARSALAAPPRAPHVLLRCYVVMKACRHGRRSGQALCAAQQVSCCGLYNGTDVALRLPTHGTSAARRAGADVAASCARNGCGCAVMYCKLARSPSWSSSQRAKAQVRPAAPPAALP